MTLEEIQLMVIKKVSEIAEAVPQPSGKFFYYDDTGLLKKAPMSEIYNLVSNSKSLGTITSASTIPAEGNVWGFAAPGTYPNAGNLTISPNTLGILTRVGGTWSKVEVALPSNTAKIATWTATAYTSGSQVVHEGKIYEANAATVVGDVPGVSPKWVEKVGGLDSAKIIGYQLTKTEQTLRKPGYYANNASTFTPHAAYTSTDLISVSEGWIISFENVPSANPDYEWRFYDANKNKVGYSKASGNGTITVSSGVKYFALYTLSGNTWKVYVEGYVDGLTLSKIDIASRNPVNSMAVSNFVLNINNGEYKEQSLRKAGYYGDDGSVFTSDESCVSTDLISVEDGTIIYFENLNPPNANYEWRFYDANKKIISRGKKIGTGQTLVKGGIAKYFSLYTASEYNTWKIYTRSPKLLPFKKYSAGELLRKPIIQISDLQVNVADMTGANDSEKYENARLLVTNAGGGKIYFGGRNFIISRAIEVYSNTEIIIDNCGIETTSGQHDNIIRTPLQINPTYPNGICLGAEITENFKITGIGNAYLKKISPKYQSDAYGWRGTTMLFTRSKNYQVTGIKILNSPMWSISNEWDCEFGYFENIEFGNTSPNGDGLNFRNGCRNMIAKKLRGFTSDNAYAITGLIFNNPNVNFSHQALGYGYSPDNGIHNIEISDVDVSATYCTGIILSSGVEISNIRLSNLKENNSGLSSVVALCANKYKTFTYGTNYQAGKIHNISIDNITSVACDNVVEMYKPDGMENAFANIVMTNLKQQKVGGGTILGDASEYVLV